jgi:ribosomal protein S18 acetylase RimI-like enzyme
MIWLSYALLIPGSNEADVTADVIEALRSHFLDKRRTLRFEILEPLWPWAGQKLKALDLKLQGRMPLTICLPGQIRPMPLPSGSDDECVALRTLSADDADQVLREHLLAARESFGESNPIVSDQEITEQRGNLTAGRYTCAYLSWSDRIAGVGAMTKGNDELVGVGTLPEYRRRGIAAAISSHLVTQHFERGAEAVWLSAGDAAAAALYEKIGFQHAGVQLNYIDEPQGDGQHRP